jgi:S1-C subfamily serine protease
MKRVPLYSRSSRHALPADPAEAPTAEATPAPAPAAPLGRRARWNARVARHERWLWLAGALLLALVVWQAARPADGRAPLTFEQIDAAIRQSMEEKPMPSKESRAYGAVLPSVVRVVGLMTEGDDGGDDQRADKVERGVGSGVVIVDNGTILTNLHVVSGARRIKVTFADGLESDASVSGAARERPRRAARQDDPRRPARGTMRSTATCAPATR